MIKTLHMQGALLASIAAPALLLQAQETSKPNVILIVTDDQGYGDLAAHGNKWIKTPVLDSLHAQCVRFTNFHTGTTSAPTRASLMTGMHFDRVGVWHTIMGRSLLKPGIPTIANYLQEAGYATAIFGKWHLGDNYPFRPQDRGFEHTLIHKGGGVGQAPDYWANDYFDDSYFRNGEPEKFTGYCTDVWFKEAMNFIDNNKQKPFFCYIATNAPHHPYYVDSIQANKYNSVANDIVSKEFYAMITNIDQNIGALRTFLSNKKLADNTILIFMSDNGTSAGISTDSKGFKTKGYNAGMRGIKGSPYEGGHRVPLFLYWKNGNVVGGIDNERLTYAPDIMPTILDLCGVKTPQTSHIDGISLKPLIKKPETEMIDRVLIVDTQRDMYLQKWKGSAVMSQQWRLINGTELYQINCDTEQRDNVAAEYPQVVSRLKLSYENWWKQVEPSNNEAFSIIIGTKHENPVLLSSHDLHTDGNYPAWHQETVREAKGANGKWMIQVATAGKYRIKLKRWPTESTLALGAKANPTPPSPTGKAAYSSGEPIQVAKATLTIGTQKWQKKVRSNKATEVEFEVNLTAGNTTLQTELIDNRNNSFSAYYVDVLWVNF